MGVDIEKVKEENPIVDVGIRLGLPLKPTKSTQSIKCLWHDDHSPSLVFMPEHNRFECKSCEEKGDTFDLIKKVKNCSFNQALEWLGVPSSIEQAKSIFDTPEAYLTRRGITEEYIKEFNLKIGKVWNKYPSIVIPLPNGKNKYRVFGYFKDENEIRFVQDQGSEVCFYKTSNKNPKELIITEGEIDSIVIHTFGYVAWTSTTGVRSIKTLCQKYLKDFDGIEKIYIATDADSEGDGEVDEIAQILGSERCYRLRPPQVKDWSAEKEMGMTSDDFKELFKNAVPIRRFGVLEFSSNNEALSIKMGYELIDELTDFRCGNTYLGAGYEKSGKTSFFLGAVINLLKQGHKIAFFNTELTDHEFIIALTALRHNITKDDAYKQTHLQNETHTWIKEKLFYCGVEQLSKDGKLDFSKTMFLAQEATKAGSTVFFFDNLTTYSSQSTESRQGWEVLASCASQIVSFTKHNKVISFIVVHTRPETVFSETPPGIRKLLDSNNIESVFDKSATIVRKPNGSDIYGGGVMRSQFSGIILIWRPLQMYDSHPELQAMTQIILENFRHSQGGSARFIFDGAKGKFTEDAIALVTQEYKK